MAGFLPTRTAFQCKEKYKRLGWGKPAEQRPWTEEEDAFLKRRVAASAPNTPGAGAEAVREVEAETGAGTEAGPGTRPVDMDVIDWESVAADLGNDRTAEGAKTRFAFLSAAAAAVGTNAARKRKIGRPSVLQHRMGIIDPAPGPGPAEVKGQGKAAGKKRARKGRGTEGKFDGDGVEDEGEAEGEAESEEELAPKMTRARGAGTGTGKAAQESSGAEQRTEAATKGAAPAEEGVRKSTRRCAFYWGGFNFYLSRLICESLCCESYLSFPLLFYIYIPHCYPSQ